MKNGRPGFLAFVFLLNLAFLSSCLCAGEGDDDDSSDGEAGDDSTFDDDSVLDDDAGEPLAIEEVTPNRGGVSVSTAVTIRGAGFAEGIRVMVGPDSAESVEVLSSEELRAVFGAVPLRAVGQRPVRVTLGDRQAILPDGFSYFFDEDPIVFVHGYFVNVHEWDVMIERFRELGYPDDRLFAVSFSSSIQSARIDARDELAPFVDDVLASTGAERVDIIAHSMGGISTRLWIKLYGGAEKVRDYVSLSGTHHGTLMACLIPWLGEGSAEQCPTYASEAESYNGVQWDLNGDPDSEDVDETPFGVEDGGGITWNALRTDSDVIDVPSTSCCLNQRFRNDCADPINVLVHGVGHIEMAYDEGVFEITQGMIRAHNLSVP